MTVAQIGQQAQLSEQIAPPFNQQIKTTLVLWHRIDKQVSSVWICQGKDLVRDLVAQRGVYRV